MALNTLKCNHLTPLHFKGLIQHIYSFYYRASCRLVCLADDT